MISRIIAAQPAFRAKLANLIAERSRIETENYGLIPGFVFTRLSGSVRARLGGGEAIIADLGIAYVKSVRAWFASNRQFALSTFVWRRLRWEIPRLFDELKVIKSPRPNEVKSDKLRAKAERARRAKRFYGPEAECEDSAMTVSDDARQDESRLADAIHDAERWLTAKERDVLRRYFGFDGDKQTLAEIGRAMGRTLARVQQIRAEAQRKIEAGLAREHRGLFEEAGFSFRREDKP